MTDSSLNASEKIIILLFYKLDFALLYCPVNVVYGAPFGKKLFVL